MTSSETDAGAGKTKTENVDANLSGQDNEEDESRRIKNDIEEANKIKVHFVPVGNAPILKRTKFGVNIDSHNGKQFASLNTFLRKMLKLKSDQSLFLYINSSFVPSPEENLKDLNDCFAIRGELVIHYALQEAWG